MKQILVQMLRLAQKFSRKTEKCFRKYDRIGRCFLSIWERVINWMIQSEFFKIERRSSTWISMTSFFFSFYYFSRFVYLISLLVFCRILGFEYCVVKETVSPISLAVNHAPPFVKNSLIGYEIIYAYMLTKWYSVLLSECLLCS